jgi:hypothetical protein
MLDDLLAQFEQLAEIPHDVSALTIRLNHTIQRLRLLAPRKSGT